MKRIMIMLPLLSNFVIICTTWAGGNQIELRRDQLRDSENIYSKCVVEYIRKGEAITIPAPYIKDPDSSFYGLGYGCRFNKLGVGCDLEDYSLYGSVVSKDAQYYKGAIDKEGAELDFSKRYKFTEKWGKVILFVIKLNREYLASHLYEGLDIKLYGEKGKRVINLPGFYIEGFLKKIDKTLERKEMKQ